MQNEETKPQLTLIPLMTADSSKVNPNNDSNDDGSWLENDDPELLDSNAEKNNAETAIDDMEQSITADDHSRKIVVEILILSATETGFTVKTNQGDTLLEDGDRLIVASQTYKVAISGVEKPNTHNDVVTPATVAQSHMPEQELDDIWSSPDDLPAPGNRFASPFVADNTVSSTPASLPIVPTTPAPAQQDPLGFLYPGAQSQAAPQHSSAMPTGTPGYDSLLGQSQLPATQQQMPAQSPTLDMHFPSLFSGGQDDAGLNINTQDPYAMSGHIEPSDPYMNNRNQGGGALVSGGEGDILKDLGIDGSTSTITQKSYSSDKESYFEQSPMDILDEYLDEGQNMSYTPQNQMSYPTTSISVPHTVNPTEFYSYQPESDTPGIFGSLKKMLQRKKTR